MIRKIRLFPILFCAEKLFPCGRLPGSVLDDMAETMYEAEGAGLAAPQIGVSERIIVIDVGQGLIPLINPKIVSAEGEERDVEGCLSIPGKNAYVTRSKKVTVTGLGLDGKEKRYEAECWPAPSNMN